MLRVTTGGAHAAPRRGGARWLVVVLAVTLTSAVGFLVLRHAAPQPAAAGSTAIAISDGVAPDRAFRGLERLVVYVHSIPSGVGATRVSQSYAVLAAEAAGLRLVNHAYGGTGVGSAARVLASSPVADAEDVVVIHTGLNDVFRRGDAAAAAGRAWIRRMLRGTTGAAGQVLVLECQPLSWSDSPARGDRQAAFEAWNAMLRHVTTFWPDVALVDACETWDPQRFTDRSGYHPNDAGHALIAGDLVNVLEDRFSTTAPAPAQEALASDEGGMRKVAAALDSHGVQPVRP